MNLADRLERELGRGRVVPPGDPRLADYGRDESDVRAAYPPDAVVLAESTAELALTARLCREAGVPLTPRGAGSGKVGGALPVRGGVVVSTERMRSIVELSEPHLLAVCQAGVVTGELAARADARGLFYPPDPASLACCTIGGNVATNAGGPRAFRYGVTREYVLGLELVLMSGEVLRVGRRSAKGVTGYDLTAGFVGSEGTLAIVSEVTVKLLPRPAEVVTALALFAAVPAAAAAVDALLRLGLRPRTLELMDRATLARVRGAGVPIDRAAGAALLVELDGEPEGLEAQLVRAGDRLAAAGAVDVAVARSPAERERLWQARRQVSTAFRQAFPWKVSEDVCVPRGALAELLGRIDAIAADLELEIASYGHAGDGNLHVNFLCPADPAGGALATRLERGLVRLFEDTLALGGTLSGEHGIGLAKRRFLALEQPPALIEWQHRLKALWDPDGLLNPGKILPARTGCGE